MKTNIHTTLKAIFEHSSEGFILLDVNLNIQVFNAKARENIFVTSMEKEILTGSSIYEYLEPSRIAALTSLFTRVLSGEPVEYDYAFPREDGSMAWFHFSYWPVTERNTVTGICISGSEINSRIVAEENVLLNEKRFRALSENSHEMLTIFNSDGDVDQQPLLISIVNSSEDAIMSTDMKGFITSWNSGAEQMMHYTAEQAVGKHISLLIPEALQEGSRQLIIKIKAGESLRQHETQLITSTGHLIDVSITFSPIRDSSGIPIGIAAIVRNVSEMKKTQAALKESEDLYRSLFENSPLPKLVAKKSNLHLVKVNRRAIQHYGYSEKELLSMTAFDLRIREEHADLLHIMEEGPDKVLKNKIVHHRKKNGDLMYVQVVLDEIQFMGMPCYLVLVNDLTEQLRLEKELSEEKLIRQKEIARATIDGQEKQRAQIGKELHDNVNQLLASAKMYVSSMHGENPREIDLIQRTRESLRICTEEIRTLSKSIVPPSLGDIGFAEAIGELVENIQAGHTRTRFTTHLFLDENRLTEGLKLSIYRIIQEQFSNIMKYASADKADLQLKQDGDSLHLVIADNGKGFDTTQKRKGIGITNIINRAELYNGSVQIVSSPGNGCTLHIKFDL